MDFNKTVDLIIKDLEEAREIIDDLKNYPGVPILQIEMAKSKCKSAGEIIALLKSIHNQVPVDDRTKTPDVDEAVKKTEIPDDKIGDDKKESGTIGDSYGLIDRLNEQMGITRGSDNVTEIIKAKPLANLDDAIGVNDKFLFIREIFNGSPESYDQAIEWLNSVKTFTEARDVLISYTGDIKETKAVRQFLDIVKRKFPSNE